MSVALLSPHLDDAVLSAWSVLRRPGEVRVVNVCAGVPPPGPPPRWDLLTGATDPSERMRERLAEDRTALARAGREGVNLDFLDEHYRTGPLDPDVLLGALDDAVGGADELWAPAGIGGHSDHVQVREAALALRAAGGPPVTLYAELPYVTRHGWPEWVSGRRVGGHLALDAWTRGFLPEGTPVPGDRHVLPRLEARRKLRAVRDYRTQWRALDSPGRSVTHRRVIRYEASFVPALRPVSTPAPSTPAP
jgi:LmbE family N-acetylglucosaminyl deacetylase